MNIKKIAAVVVAVLVIVLAGIVIYNVSSGGSEQPINNSVADNQEQSANNSENNEQTDNTADNEGAVEEEKVYTPTFMYFVSNSDTDFEKTTAMLDELKKEYGDKITFEIKNIDDEPELKDNFPVEGQTPALIMLNTSNDISAFEFQCSDKDKLIECIKNALN